MIASRALWWHHLATRIRTSTTARTLPVCDCSPTQFPSCGNELDRRGEDVVGSGGRGSQDGLWTGIH